MRRQIREMNKAFQALVWEQEPGLRLLFEGFSAYSSQMSSDLIRGLYRFLFHFLMVVQFEL